VRGRVLWEQGAHVTASTLSTLYTRLQAAYPQAETIYVAQDNWPVHFHPNVLVGLAPQDWPWPFNRPPNWSAEATIAAPRTTLHIQLLGLPTYASWLNPVEKLWRWLQQDVTHLHRLADDWTALQQRIADFLNRFTADSPDLLQYVGLGAHN